MLEEVVLEGKFDSAGPGGGDGVVANVEMGLEEGRVESFDRDGSGGALACDVPTIGEFNNGKLAKELRSLGPIKKVPRGRKLDVGGKGPKKKEASLYFKEFIKDHGVLFVGLVETKINAFDKGSLEKVLGPDWDFFMMPSEGLSGGIMILWRSDLASLTCVIGNLNVFNKGEWMIATVYRSKEVVKRRRLWGCIQDVANRKVPLIVGGDFNCILSQEDKRGGRKFVFSQGPKEMMDFMMGNDLHEVGFVGPKFTWCNNKSGGARILETLDRCLLNSLAINCIQVAVVRHLARIASDHYPLVLKIFDSSTIGRGIIKFEDVWISYKGSSHIIAKVWSKIFCGDDMEVLNKKCRKALKDLFYWGKAKVKEFSKEKDKLKKDIFLLQEEEANVGWLSEDKLWVLRSKVKELNVTLVRLNTWWKQRANGRWNMDKLDLFFGKELVGLISNIQICQGDELDVMELIGKVSGKFISALLREDAVIKAAEVDPFAWIHKVDLNARVELFIWRLCKEAVPTADYLLKRRLASSNLCPRGCGEVEDVDHVTSKCSKLIKVGDILRSWGFSIPFFLFFSAMFG
ncbi:hypothetical protein M5K25_000511 [Dendrobium thyrsiflorum]|uniref:Reverse transcriptase n=1 Tax=Dendrobium thyrsiflorum TaxID=117978 RepID=A0ABD0VU17_DENTH